MSAKGSSLNGVLFVLFLILSLGALSFLFSQWHENNVGGIEDIVINKTEKKVVIRMGKYNSYQAKGTINDIDVTFLIDTGANSVAVPQWLASKAGLKPLQSITVHTASGKAMGQRTWIRRLSVGPILLQNIQAIILPDNSNYVLLGMSALKKLEFSHRDDAFILIQAID
jgi:aspartyl protease family protein